MRRLLEISVLPETNQGEWLSSAESAVDFLKENAQSDRIVLFASLSCTLIHGVLAPLANLESPDQAELSRDFIQLDNSWMIEHVSGGGEPDRVYLANPMDRQGVTLKGGEKLIFMRSAAWSDTSKIELSQKLVHALDLHFVPERSAYCRLDENGDLLDVITVFEKSSEKWTESIKVVTIRAQEFTEYMRLADMGLVFFFDFTRVGHGFHGWIGERHFDHKARDLFYHGGVMEGHASYVNGRQIARPTVTLEEIVRAHIEERNPSARQYATFKAVDLKSGEHIKVSCDEKCLSNYFQPESSLPLEMSPVFFRGEVLHRYKADPEKYQLDDRTIYCRGTWSLRTYDVNNVGQVHTYLRYLRELPYNEQLYWQSFNEWPKGPLSERAITTDFKGEIYTEYDSLQALKRKVVGLDAERPGWWNPRGETLVKAVRYPVTASASEWANEILALDQLLGEALQQKELRALAKKLGRNPQPDWKAFKLIEECLIGHGVDEDEAHEAIQALRTVRDLRNITKGHSATKRRLEMEKEVKTRFGSFRAHFASLASDCDKALDLVVRTLDRP